MIVYLYTYILYAYVDCQEKYLQEKLTNVISKG